MPIQYFKGDDTETRIEAAGYAALAPLSLSRDELLAGAYTAGPLGDMIFYLKRSPLSSAIKQAIFRVAFQEIFEAFVKVGTFEAYLTVFRRIFGSGVTVSFTVPAPGRLQINIVAAGVELSDFITRSIVNNAYVFDEIVNENDFNIALQTVKGFQNQYELEQMLFELVPGGVFTEISLTLGV